MTFVISKARRGYLQRAYVREQTPPEYGSLDTAFKFITASIARKYARVGEKVEPTPGEAIVVVRPPAYNAAAVDEAIASSSRHGRKIGRGEARKIHALLKGWRGNPSDLHVAETILSQLGGGKFVAMTGARSFAGSADSLTFKLPSSPTGIRAVRVTLMPNDLYVMTFYKRGRRATGDLEPVAERNGVYADQLRNVFTSVTGLETSLGTLGNPSEDDPEAYGDLEAIFGSHFGDLTDAERSALAEDLRDLMREDDSAPWRYDTYRAAKELRRRLGGASALPVYAGSLARSRERA